MTVAEFIAFLKEQPQDIQVAYRLCSEQCLLETGDIVIADMCEPRPDGWIQSKRSDKPTQTLSHASWQLIAGQKLT